ncbi:MAG: NUDIX domain-containing protein [Cyanobacteria bacterium REEB67]|nr:NUDIX domain-containing protein [Cyanobacteria bacterium REEB67]
MSLISVNTLVHCPLCASTLKVVDLGGKDRLACGICEFVHWNNPKPVTATLVTTDNGLVLVQRKFEPFIGGWCLPGGFIEDSEHPAESAAREVLEETGLEVEITKLISATAPGRGINVVILFYLARQTGGELIAGDDASAAGAFHQDNLPDICFDLHRQMVAQYFQADGKL